MSDFKGMSERSVGSTAGSVNDLINALTDITKNDPVGIQGDSGITITRDSLDRSTAIVGRLLEIFKDRQFDKLLGIVRLFDEPLVVRVGSLIDDAADREAKAEAETNPVEFAGALGRATRRLNERFDDIRERLAELIYSTATSELAEIGSVADQLETLASESLETLLTRSAAFEVNYDLEEGGKSGLDLLEEWQTLASDILLLRDSTFADINDAQIPALPPPLDFGDSEAGQRGIEQATIDGERDQLTELTSELEGLETLVARLLSLVIERRERLKLDEEEEEDEERATKRPRVECSLCASKAKYACGGCKAAFYCAKKCQRRHWNDAHRFSCPR